MGTTLNGEPGLRCLEVSLLSKVEAGTSRARDVFLRAEEEARYGPPIPLDKSSLYVWSAVILPWLIKVFLD